MNLTWRWPHRAAGRDDRPDDQRLMQLKT